jgi:ATP-dependent DNA ligase
MLKIPETLRPTSAKALETPPIGTNWRYEPGWDGFRCLVFRDGTLSLRSRRGTLLNRYFPEVVGSLLRLKQRPFVLDGYLLIMVNGRSDIKSLRLRIHPADNRVQKLSMDLPATFMATDLLLDETGADLRGEPFDARRAALEAFIRRLGKQRIIELSPLTSSLETARDWIQSGRESGVRTAIAKDGYKPYRQGRRDLLKFTF